MKRPNGAPSKYREEYCEMLIVHQQAGFSFESFAATIDVNRDTLYEWAKVHKNFSDARKKAKEKALHFWEDIGIKGLKSGKDFNAAIWIYNMKCRFSDQWADKKETEITGTPIQIKIDSEDSKL